MVTEAIVLAGGLGTRLRSVVADLPKAMAPIAGRPFLAYLLEYLESQGIQRVVLAVGYRSQAIRDWFGDRYRSLELVYSLEQEPLGTGGGLRQALPHIRGTCAFALNGDTFIRVDCGRMARLWEQHSNSGVPGNSVMVALRRIEDAGRYGAVQVVGGSIVGFAARGIQGPGLINAGCYLVARDIFERYPMPAKFSWEADFLEVRATEILPLAFETEAAFIDIGIPEALEEAQTLIPRWLSTVA